MTLNRKYQIKIQNIQKTLKASFLFLLPPWSIMALKQRCVSCVFYSRGVKAIVQFLPASEWQPVNTGICSGAPTVKGGKGHMRRRAVTVSLTDCSSFI